MLHEKHLESVQYLEPFFAAQNSVPHVIPGSGTTLFRMLFALHVEVQRDLGVDADAEVAVHHTLFIQKIPENNNNNGQVCKETMQVSSSYVGSSSTSIKGETAAHRASALANNTLLIRPPVSTSVSN